MYMKKTAALMAAFVLAASLSACGSGASTATETTAETSTGETEAADETAEPVTDINNFADQAQTYLEYIAENLPSRFTGEDGHAQAVEWIIGELEQAGYTDDQITSAAEEDAYGNTVQNIVLTVEGQDTSKEVLVGAHYDGDGVGDNGSGIALLLSTAVGLQDQKPLYSVKYVFFDAEEDGCFGSTYYAENMTEEELNAIVYMINIDSIGFGDYCNVYGGLQDDSGEVSLTEGYDMAMAKAEALGFNTMGTEDLDGYYAENGEGPAIEANTLYTNPWTAENPAPENGLYNSPSTGDWSDHVCFKYMYIPYIYMEATNWYAEGDGGTDAYTGYFDTGKADLAESGMFMNTEYDTLENLNNYFPGRSLNHFNVYSPLLSSLILNPASDQPTAE